MSTSGVTYCEQWSVTLAQPVEPLTVEEARLRDQAGGEWYTVVLGDATKPDCYLEIAWENDHIGVWFLDDRMRRWTNYSFKKVDDERMFLWVVTTYSYPRRAGRALSDASAMEETTYKPEGIAIREVTDFTTDKVMREEYRDVSVDNLWEPVPAFGDYRSISRLDRDTDPSVEG